MCVIICRQEIETRKWGTQDLADWADASKDGLILFSLGLHMNLQLNPKMFSSLMGAFSNLEQRVIFKANIAKEALASVKVPKNVILRRVIPLRHGLAVSTSTLKFKFLSFPTHFRTLLAHPNTVLLINQAGSNSPIEAINNCIPMISMPLNMDQV